MDNKDKARIHQELLRYYGAMSEVAKRAKVSRQTVMQVLKGEWFNEEVIEHACVVLQERKRSRDNATSLIATTLAAL